jgi:hypothetical protein
MAGVSSQGTTFSFAGSVFTITSVQVQSGSERQRVSAPHMGLAANAFEPTFVTHRTIDELPTVSIEYIGSARPEINTSGSLSVTGRLTFSGTATCTSSQVGAAVGELVRGSASFRVQV